MLLRRILFSPFTVFYGAILQIRHGLYDLGVLKSSRPIIPTIAIGNLALGGTGKTPMLELVLRTLDGIGPLATLSRGYGRKSRTIHEVSADDHADHSGDEPVQVKTNFPGVRVFVGADRVQAIARIQRNVPQVKAVVLDDALQHRRLNASLNILLTTAQRPYCDDALIPAGTLRDLRTRAKTARIVVVTKCAQLPTPEDQTQWRARLDLLPAQDLFFAGITYDAPRTIQRDVYAGAFGQQASALIVTGMVQPEPFVVHVRSLFGNVEHIAFPDHHAFTPADLQRLADVFGSFAAGPKTLITTEKDAARLRPLIAGSPLDGLTLAVIGMRTVILNEPERFADLIRTHVATHPAHR
ncbi:MAG: tetraacyldisaccharide 4'-kinase [Flavobacteriales bacterium]